MRRLYNILVINVFHICFLPSLFAQQKTIDYQDYFINKQPETAVYQQYKGAIIAFYEPLKTDKAQFNLEGIEIGEPYIIDKITVLYALGVPHVDMRISKKDVKGGKKIRIWCVSGESTDKKPGIVDLPAYLYEPVEELKAEYLDKEVYSYGKKYTITGVGFGVQLVTFIFSSTDGDEFEEPVNEALDYMYVDRLVSVEKPENEAIPYGKTTIVTEGQITKYSYVDNVLGIVIYHDNTQFEFLLQNESDNTLKIIWDEAAFVDANGSTSKVIHSGVKYSEKENSQVPSVIVRGAKLSDIAVPVDKLNKSNSTWISLPLYSEGQVGNIALLLPIQIKGVTNEYIFVFERKMVPRHPELHAVIIK